MKDKWDNKRSKEISSKPRRQLELINKCSLKIMRKHYSRYTVGISLKATAHQTPGDFYLPFKSRLRSYRIQLAMPKSDPTCNRDWGDVSLISYLAKIHSSKICSLPYQVHFLRWETHFIHVCWDRDTRHQSWKCHFIKSICTPIENYISTENG